MRKLARATSQMFSPSRPMKNWAAPRRTRPPGLFASGPWKVSRSQAVEYEPVPFGFGSPGTNCGAKTRSACFLARSILADTAGSCWTADAPDSKINSVRARCVPANATAARCARDPPRNRRTIAASTGSPSRAGRTKRIWSGLSTEDSLRKQHEITKQPGHHQHHGERVELDEAVLGPPES